MELRNIASLRWTAGITSLFHGVFAMAWMSNSCMCGASMVMGGAFLAGMVERGTEAPEPLMTLLSLGGVIVIVSFLLALFALTQTYSLIRFGAAIGSKRVRASEAEMQSDPGLVERQREDLRKGAKYFTMYTILDGVIAFLACVAVGIVFVALS